MVTNFTNRHQIISELETLSSRKVELERINAECWREQEVVVRSLEEDKCRTEKLVDAMMNTIQAMVMILEMRDPYTAGHHRRVTELACAIARELNISKHRINGLQLAGLIHDIGKLRIPVEVLKNPNKLSGNEFSMIKTHPLIGYDLSIHLPRQISQIVSQHHERINGSGYPEGISGEGIMLEARILAVADVVEAITAQRPYRLPHSINYALDEIRTHAGILYDREIVNACLKLFREKLFEFKYIEISNIPFKVNIERTYRTI